jgi:uroporphyrinogen-III synthase
MADAPLAGLTIAITRPPEQAASTIQALHAGGAIVLEYPVLDIVPLAARTMPLPVPACGAIFVSANAVQYGASLVHEQLGPSSTVPVYAIGKATAAVLKGAGFEYVVSPQQTSDSEGLLALPQLQSGAIRGQHIILVRGRSPGGGRKLIEETLFSRGAVVHALECYERRAAAPSIEQRAALLAALQSRGKPAVMALSVETLDHLLASLAVDPVALANLRKSAWLLVPHPRIGSAARERGFLQVAEVPMSADALVVALIGLKAQWRA